MSWPKNDPSKRVSPDFLVLVLSPVFDLKAITEKPEYQTKIKSHMVVQAHFLPPSLRETEGWMKFKAELDKE